MEKARLKIGKQDEAMKVELISFEEEQEVTPRNRRSTNIYLTLGGVQTQIQLIKALDKNKTLIIVKYDTSEPFKEIILTTLDITNFYITDYKLNLSLSETYIKLKRDDN
jgi:hypothetical protein